MEVKPEKPPLETRFIKVGNDYISVANLERFLEIEEDIYVSTISGKEFTVHAHVKNDTFTIDAMARKLNEKALDVIQLDKLISDDEGSLLHKEWLEATRQDKPNEPKKKTFWKKIKK